MARTSELLVEFRYLDLIPNNSTVMCDYFGRDNLKNEENINWIWGVYEWLVKNKGVSADDLHDALISDKLNELIHKKYKNQKSFYYNKFCELNLKVGTQIDVNDEDLDSDKIKDDNHCPNCGKEGYYNINKINDSAPDCKKCFKFICKLCSKYDKESYSRTCLKCISREDN